MSAVSYKLIQNMGDAPERTLTSIPGKSNWTEGQVHDDVYKTLVGKVKKLAMDGDGNLNPEFHTVTLNKTPYVLKLVADTSAASASTTSAPATASPTKAENNRVVSTLTVNCDGKCLATSALATVITAIFIGSVAYFYPEESAAYYGPLAAKFGF